MRFNPCAGREFCTEEETHCRGCGRSHQEIAATRELIRQVADLAERYENADEFLAYLARKAGKTVASRREG